MSDLGRERLFLGVALDAETRGLLAVHLATHAGTEVPGRVVPPQNWHLTLRFLGWVTDLQRDGILREIDEADLPAPFTVRFDAFGAFPKLRRATVLWVGLDRGLDELAVMARVCEEAAEHGGFSPEDRPYVPHVTLSRIRPQQDVTALVGRLPPFTVTMAVREMTLFRSTLLPGGAMYDAVDTIAL